MKKINCRRFIKQSLGLFPKMTYQNICMTKDVFHSLTKQRRVLNTPLSYDKGKVNGK